jgi:hypothetical protein
MFAAVYRAALHYSNQGQAPELNPSFVIQCKHIDYRIVIPLKGPFEAAIQNRPPESLYVGIVPGGKLTAIANPVVDTPALLGLFEAAIQPCLINQFTRHIGEIRSTHSKHRHLWPDAWQMAWCIRNGLAHGGCVTFSLKDDPDPSPVKWRGLSIDKSHQGKSILGNLVNVGDLIALSIDMEEARSGPLPFQVLANQPIY